MPREYADHIVDILSPLRGVSARAMFGGFGLSRNGLMFGIIVNDTLYFKVTGTNRADYEAAGAAPFVYQAKGKRVAMSYWNVPAEAFDDEETLLAWAEKACSAAREKKDAARPKQKKPSKTKR
jgi:DNA transformation protein